MLEEHVIVGYEDIDKEIKHIYQKGNNLKNEYVKNIMKYCDVNAFNQSSVIDVEKLYRIIDCDAKDIRNDYNMILNKFQTFYYNYDKNNVSINKWILEKIQNGRMFFWDKELYKISTLAHMVLMHQEKRYALFTFMKPDIFYNINLENCDDNDRKIAYFQWIIMTMRDIVYTIHGIKILSEIIEYHKNE